MIKKAVNFLKARELFPLWTVAFAVLAVNLYFFYLRPSPLYSNTISFENELTKGPYGFSMYAVDGVRQVGEGYVKEIDGRAVIAFQLGEFESGNVVQPAFIHSGQCSDLEAKVLYTTFARQGVSVGTFYRLSVDELKSYGQLSVAVNKSFQDNTVVACGELKYDL